MIQLDERLRLAEALLGPCSRVIDVGSNHGFLPVHMLLSGLCGEALICDVSADALRRAEGLVRLTRLEDRARILVTDGLDGVALQPGDAVAVCGMGARTIAHILKEALPCPAVVQANVELPLLRRHVEKIGMHIEREGIACAAGRYYVAMRLAPGRGDSMTEEQALLGPGLMREKPPLWPQYLQWRLGVARRALEGLEKGGDAARLARAQWENACLARAVKEAEA